MRETQFIRQNQEKWAEFEQTLKDETKDANRLRDLFVEITDDLSYSRTFYPNRSVRVYLNGLAQQVFQKIYRGRHSGAGRLLSFWTDELPREIYAARGAFRLALFVFILSMGIGMLSCAFDDTFAEAVLGSSYVDMTRANIESGDPMAVYKERGRFNMFLGITFNNVYVAFLAFSLGVFFGVGSLIILISNAIMVGCFQYFFIREGLFWESFLTIWIHGTLEISAIVIASAAGITMGHGPAFPGTFTRLQAFQQSARRGAKIMLGTIPLFIVAGFLEGYMTRQTETPDAVRGLFILLCLAFVLGYFVWYPWYHHRTAPPVSDTPDAPRIPISRTYHLDTGKIKAGGEIFGETFAFIRTHAALLAVAVLGGALLYTTLVFGISEVPAQELLPFNQESWMLNGYNFVLLFSGHESDWLLPVAGGTMLYVVALATYRGFDTTLGRKASPWAYPALVLGVAMLILSVGFRSEWVILTLLAVLPPALLLAFTAYHEGRVNPGYLVERTFALLQRSFWRTVGMAALLLLLGLMLFSVLNSLLAQLFFQAINWLVTADQVVLDVWSLRLNTFLLAVIANFIWVILLTGFGLHYFSLREILESNDLREKVSAIGQQRRIQGMERES